MKSIRPQIQKVPKLNGTNFETNDTANQTKVDLTTPSHVSNDNVSKVIISPQDSPKMPHERDQSVDMTGGIQSKKVQQAAKDIKNGLKDTSRGTEADIAYQKQK